MKKAILFTLLLLNPFAAEADFAKSKIAVLDFKIQGTGFKTKDMGEIVAEWLITALVKEGRFDVIERRLLNKILGEQKLGATGMLEEESVSKLGKLLGVKVIISGSVIRFQDIIEVNARIIDVESASIITAESVKDTTAIGLEKLVRNMAEKIIKDFPLEGYVVQRKGDFVTIDLGKRLGVKRKMQFMVFKEGEIIKHPITGEILDVEHIETGIIEIVDVSIKISKAIIVREQSPNAIVYAQRVKSMIEPVVKRVVQKQPLGVETEAVEKEPVAMKTETIEKTPEAVDTAVVSKIQDTVKKELSEEKKAVAYISAEKRNPRLFVNIKAKDSRVRILNIKPKFNQGIELKKGTYHIEASAPGYETKTIWITLKTDEDRTIKFRLKKKPQQKAPKLASPSPEAVKKKPQQETPKLASPSPEAAEQRLKKKPQQKAPKVASLSPQAAGPKIIDRESHFIKYETGVVKDTKTGLQWIVGPDKNIIWSQAKLWVDELDLDGGGWRLPTRNELKGRYQNGIGTRNMTPLLKTTGWLVWYGETEGGASAWHFPFDFRKVYWDFRTFSRRGRVFAVRSP